MARRARRAAPNRNRVPKRDYIPIARHRLLSVPVVRLRRLDLRAFEDRRHWSPMSPVRFSWPRRIKRLGAVKAVLHEEPRGHLKSSLSSLRMSFVAPKRVLVCVRRKQRREVLHAMRRLKSGGAKRRTEWSDVKC